MRIAPPLLLLAEGDAEGWNSWSGSSHSILVALRSLGCTVRSADVEMSGPVAWLPKALAFSWPRRRWAQRFHLGAPSFRARSRRAQALVRTHRGPILQVGATFDAAPLEGRSLYCFCDANAAFAAGGGRFGPVSHLTESERMHVIERERRLYQRCAGIFTLTDKLRRSFIDAFGVSESRVVTTLAGPNLRTIPTDAEACRGTEPPPRILFVGRQFDRKGGPELVRAFAQVRQQVPAAQLVIAGCNPGLGAEPGIEVRGHVSRDDPGDRGLGALFRSADIFCMPSHYEAFGVVFCEAMLHGLPCVGSREYASEIIRDGIDGWLVDAGNIEQLATVLTSAIRQRQQLRLMGLAARQRALADFNWARVASIIEEYIRRTWVAS
jgi:glycosyltransferase involved in cell wall biosynthesis